MRKRVVVMAFLEYGVPSLHFEPIIRKEDKYNNSVFSPVVDSKQGAI